MTYLSVHDQYEDGGVDVTERKSKQRRSRLHINDSRAPSFSRRRSHRQESIFLRVGIDNFNCLSGHGSHDFTGLCRLPAADFRRARHYTKTEMDGFSLPMARMAPITVAPPVMCTSSTPCFRRASKRCRPNKSNSFPTNDSRPFASPSSFAGLYLRIIISPAHQSHARRQQRTHAFLFHACLVETSILNPHSFARRARGLPSSWVR